MEEAEHCWDSVPDLLVQTSLQARIGVITLFWLLYPVSVAQPLIEGCIYGWRTLVNPLKLVSSLFLYFTADQLQTFMQNHSVLCLTVLGMRPSNKAYEHARSRWAETHYLRVADKFKVTHTQEPHHHLRKSGAMGHASAAVGKHGATFKLKAAVKALQAFGGAPMHGAEQAVAQLRSARLKLYKKTTTELLAAGIDQEDLNHGAWDFLAKAA